MERDSNSVDLYHRTNSYRPQLCGDCKYWDEENAEREKDHGQLMAQCKKFEHMTARTDWCQCLMEVRNHERAMQVYRG